MQQVNGGFAQKKVGAIQRIGMALGVVLVCCGLASSQTWVTMNTGKAPPFNVGVALQLTDGRILVQENGTSNWWTLTADKSGLYRNGTWKKVASFPAAMNYVPLYFTSAVLPDGRVIVEGGEYNNGVQDWTNKGAIYDPVKNTWTEVKPPSGWTQIGDAQSVVLPNGTFMMANINNGETALLNAKTLTWTVTPGTGKNDVNDEEGWTLLPDGKVLTVDTYVFLNDPSGMNSEIYDPSTQAWTSAGSTKAQLWDSRAGCGGKNPSNEIGPGVLMLDGRVFYLGANTCGVAGHTAFYDTTTGTWSKGPNIPGVNDVADGPAAVLPNGHVLVDTNPGYGISPSTFYSFNGSGWNTIPQPTGLTSSNTEGHRLLMTAAGTVLFTHVGNPEMWFFVPVAGFDSAAQPVITSLPSTVTRGKTYTVGGTQLNGITQGAMFGDDAQSATNYPLVLITNNSTGHKFYARTHGFSTMSIAPGKASTAKFDVPAGMETGGSTLQVIANGIASAALAITVN